MKVQTVRDLIAILSQLPPDATVDVAHEVYMGGDTERRFDEPVLLINADLNWVLISADDNYGLQMAKSETLRDWYTVGELLEADNATH